jgi:signal transduction histidine kinase
MKDLSTDDLPVGSDIYESVRMENELLKEKFDLIERNKELTCLYGMANIMAMPGINLHDTLQEIVELIPPAFQYPELASAEIRLDDQVVRTSRFRTGTQKLSEDIVIQEASRGLVKVIYALETQGSPKSGDLSFLKEECSLLRTIAHQLALIIERKEAEEKHAALENQLRHADRLAKVGQLSAGIAHELNGPLGNILGFAQLAMKDPSVPSQVVRDLDNIVKSSLYAREIIKKLMLFSRQMPQQKHKINLNHVISEGLSFLEPRLIQNGIRLKLHLASELPDILADSSQFNQVLVNLILNALHAMPKGGTLTVETSCDTDEILLVVEDTGVGMDPDVLEQVFVPFFTTKDVDQGTGLGLSVVHGIIQAHDGSIVAASRKGKGSRFTIRLPIPPKD